MYMSPRTDNGLTLTEWTPENLATLASFSRTEVSEEPSSPYDGGVWVGSVSITTAEDSDIANLHYTGVFQLAYTRRGGTPGRLYVTLGSGRGVREMFPVAEMARFEMRNAVHVGQLGGGVSEYLFIAEPALDDGQYTDQMVFSVSLSSSATVPGIHGEHSEQLDFMPRPVLTNRTGVTPERMAALTEEAEHLSREGSEFLYNIRHLGTLHDAFWALSRRADDEQEAVDEESGW